MTEAKREELKQLLQEAMENLEIQQRSANSSPLSPMDLHGYRVHLRQYWQSYSDTSYWVVGSYESNIVNEDVKSKLLDYIREEFAQFIHEDIILSASLSLIGGFANGFPLNRLLDQLMRIAIARGIEEAVSVFDRGTKETHGFFQYLVLLEGIKIETETQLFDGIRLVPMPNSTSELPYHLSSASFGKPENFFSEKTLLVIDYLISPIFHKPFQASTMQEHSDQLLSTFRSKINSKDFLKFKMDDFPLNLLCQALSLACHSEVINSFFTRFLAADKLYNLSHGFRSGGNWHFHPPGNVKEAEQSEINEAKRVFGILINLDSSTLKKLQIAIDRWIKSKTHKDPEDKIIDLVIAFEALYLPDAGESTFKFAVRASWYLGKDREDRTKLFEVFKELYKCRSKVVHGGELKESVTIEVEPLPIGKFITRAQGLCRDSIEKIMKHCSTERKFPKNDYWDSLILGEESS